MAPHHTPKSLQSIQHQLQIKKLKNELKYTDQAKKKVELYDAFSERWLMPKELWIKRLKLVKADDKVERYRVLMMAIEHLYYDKQAIEYESIHLKLLKSPKSTFLHFDNTESLLLDRTDVDKSLPWLQYPHSQIRQYCMRYERSLSSPPSQKLMKQVEKMETLYPKIKAASKNPEKWLSAMAEVGDIQFVKHNVEQKLGMDLTNQKLWKLYIEYLRRENAPEEMLKVYGKYCRYFIEDTKMKEEYRAEVEKHGGVTVSWKNPFEFETPSTTSEDLMKEFWKELPYSRANEKFQCPKVDRNFMLQIWPLPRPMILYVMENAKSTVSQKLQQCCKYFFFKDPMLFCYRLLFNFHYIDSIQFHESSAEFSNVSASILPKKRLYITAVFEFHGDDDDDGFNDDQMPTTRLSQFIKETIYQCDARFIEISGQHIMEKEFEFLVGHGDVEEILLNECEIKKENGQLMTIEEILSLMPKARCVSINNHSYLSSNSLSKLTFINKILYFRVSFIQHDVDLEDFATFIKKNAAPNSQFKYFFHQEADQALIENVKEVAENVMKQWKPYDEMPKIKIFVTP